MIRIGTWNDVVHALAQRPSGAVLRLPKGWLAHPRAVGMRASVGLPQGQVGDYRYAFEDGSGLHVKDFGNHYQAHLDEIDPAVDPVAHLAVDAPSVFIGSGAALGAAIGAAAGKTSASTAAGAAVGGLLALGLAAVAKGNR